MSRTLPDTYIPQRAGSFAAGGSILAGDWVGLNQMANHLYQRLGARIPLYWVTGSDADSCFSTTSTSYTSADDNDSLRPLTLFTGVFRLTREMLAADIVQHELTLVGVGKGIDLLATVFAPDTNEVLGTITATNSSALVGSFEASLNLTKVAADAGGIEDSDPRILGVSIQARVNTDSPALLYHAMLYESYIDATQLPDGTTIGEIVTEYAWNNDLAGLPSLTFDATLSSSITEAQMLAGLSISSGALRVDLNAMLSAGASSGAFGVMWLTGKVVAGPGQLYMDCNNTTSTGTGANNGMIGLALYYYADSGDASPSNPPGGSAAYTSAELGRQGSGSRGYNRVAFGAAFASSANSDFVAQTLDWLPYSNGRAGIVRSGAAYPPVASSIAISESRSVNSAPMADTHRGRLALIVRLTGTTSLPTIDIRRVQLDYTP